MALHKLLVDDFYDASFSLLAIHCRLEDYRLAFLLNKYLHLKLERKPEDVDYKYFASTYAIYEWEDEALYTTWNLVSNICKKEEDSLLSNGSLFNNKEKVLNTYYLLPEFKKVDFLVKITNENRNFNEKLILDQIQEIPQIITAYSIDAEQIKSKDNLIF